MRIPLATNLKTRTGAPSTKDARQVNSYMEVKGDQAAVRKRPAAQGGISIGTGTAQGGIGFSIGGTPYFIGFWGDTMQTYTGSGTSWSSGANYLTGDHVAVNFVDYWALNNNTNSQPPSGNWSRTYVPAVPILPGWQWASTTFNVGTNYAPTGLAYGASKYVLFLYDINTGVSNISTSTDGITWTLPSPIAATFDSNIYSLTTGYNYNHTVAFGNGIFVKTGMYKVGSNGIMYSSNGTTWTYVTNPVTADQTVSESVAFGNGIFVRTLVNSGTTLTETYSSTDGITWTKRSPALTIGFVSFANGRFFIGMTGAFSASTCYTSTDGITWAAVTLPSIQTWSEVNYIGGKYIWVASNATTTYATSTDGVTWNTATDANSYFNRIRSSANDGSRVVACSTYSLNNLRETAQTTDGSTYSVNTDYGISLTGITYFMTFGTSIIGCAILSDNSVVIGKLT